MECLESIQDWDGKFITPLCNEGPRESKDVQNTHSVTDGKEILIQKVL